MHLMPIKKILVIRFSAISDVVLSSVLCDTLKISFPDAQVDYLVHEPSDQLFQYNPSIDRVIAIDAVTTKRPFLYLKLLMRLRRERYDLIVDATSTVKSELISLFSRRSPIRIGQLRKKRGFLYTHKVDGAAHEKNKLNQQLAMLKPLSSLGYQILFQHDTTITITDDEKLAMRDSMVGQGVDFNRPRFAISVSAEDEFKKWNTDSLVDVIEHCRQTYNAQIILFNGRQHERKDVESVHEKLGYPDDVFINISTPKLRDVAILFSMCDVYIGNEGEPRHLAQAVGIPTASVFSPQMKISEWLPLNDSRHQAIEWRSVSKIKFDALRYEHGDSLYNTLYNSIKAKDFIPVVDRVVQTYVKPNKEVRHVS